MSSLKATKRALLSGIVAIFLSISMLVGTTFAWFTDTASTAVNKIQAGTLDIELQYATAWDEAGTPTAWDNAEGKTLEFRKAAGHEGEAVLWEPGCTYELPAIRIKNNGNLALKYKLAITGIKGDAALNNVIEWTNGSTGALLTEYTGTMIPGENDNVTEPIVIKGHMAENAGNEYQGLSIDGIGITVVATQYTYEYDSFDNQYDNDAVYPANSITFLNNESGKTIVLESGKTYTVGNVQAVVAENGDITYTNSGAAQTVIIRTDGGTLTVNAPSDTVYHYGRAVIVNVEQVASSSYHEFGEVISLIEVAKGRVALEAGSKVDVIKVADEAAAGDVTITNNSDVQVRSFALEGVLTAANVSGTGTVDIIPTDAGNKFIAVSDYSELAAALANVANGTYVDPVIYCPAGNYQFDDYIFTQLTNQNVTILGGGTDKTTFNGFGINATASRQMGLGLYFKLFGNASVDIREIRFKDFARYDTAGNPIVGNYDNYGQGIYVSGGSDNTCSLNVKECAFEGLGGRSFLSVGAGNTTIEDCYFDAGDRHYSTINVIEIFGGKKVEVKNSYFKNVLNMDPDWPSTAIAIFDTTGKWDADSTIEISGCTFDTCEDYCINHELVFNNRAPVPVVKNITYINCEDVIAHIYISNILTGDNPLPEGAVDEIFVVTGYSTYLTYCCYSTDENGVKYEIRYYCSGTAISSDCEVSSMYVDTEITIGAGVTVTVKGELSIGEGATLKGEAGAKLVIAEGCIIYGAEMTAGTYVWNTDSNSWVEENS